MGQGRFAKNLYLRLLFCIKVQVNVSLYVTKRELNISKNCKPTNY